MNDAYFPTVRSWDDDSPLRNKKFLPVLDLWHTSNPQDRERTIANILKDIRQAFSIRAWLQYAFAGKKVEACKENAEVFFTFYCKLRDKQDACQYLNEVRRTHGLPFLLDIPQAKFLPKPQRLNLSFKKNTANTKSAIHHISNGNDSLVPSSSRRASRLTSQRDSEKAVSSSSIEDGEITTDTEVGVAAIKVEETVDSSDSDLKLLVEASSEERFEFTNLQKDNSVSNDYTDWKAEHGAQSISHSCDESVHPVGDMGTLGGGATASSLSSEEAQHLKRKRKTKASEESRRHARRKVDPPSKMTTRDSDCISPTSTSPSFSTNPLHTLPEKQDEDGWRGISVVVASQKRGKGKRDSRLETGSYPLWEGILSTPCLPSSDYDHTDATHLVIMESEGGQQVQDSQHIIGDLEQVSDERGLDCKPQSEVVLDSKEFVSPVFSQKPQPSTFLTKSEVDNFDQPPKCQLSRLPPIWAESRQEVCEAFDWFRSYQGGVYQTDNTVKGYLLSAFASKRDVFMNDGRLIISHGGGKSESVGSQKGISVTNRPSDQQADDISVRALLHNYHSGRPLVLLVDDKYALFPYDLSSKGITYSVLGFYSIVYAWAEFQSAKNEAGRVIRYKFAFRWCEEQGSPWWCSEDTWTRNQSIGSIQDPWIKSQEDEIQLPIKSTSITCICPSCGSSSRKVYSTWVCLATNCNMFWKNLQMMDLLSDDLEYDEGFFDLPPCQPLPAELSLTPHTPMTRAMNGSSTTYQFTRGIHCSKCGRLSCRYQWEKLQCKSCDWTEKADISIRSAKDFWFDRLPISFAFFQMSSVSDIIVEPMRSFSLDRGRGIIQTFTLPNNRGYIHHIRTPSSHGMIEADEIFKHYQEEAIAGNLKFRRWPLKAHKCRGPLLTNYFSHNAGEPYQYVGGDDNTVPFEQVAPVTEARGFIQNRILRALERSATFNEVLSVAYMERQKMAFHSDAEVGLGPLVAGLSLGSPGLMHFRLHARHDPASERRGILLTVVLRHGDVLVMDGHDVQEYYEHTVIPNNFRIAATARQINAKQHNQA